MTRRTGSPFAEAVVGACRITADLAALTLDSEALSARCTALTARCGVLPTARPAAGRESTGERPAA
jgi:hypothetical protein